MEKDVRSDWPHFLLCKHISMWHRQVDRERRGGDERRGGREGERATDLVYPWKYCRFCLREFSASDRYLLSAFKRTIITFRLRLMWRTRSIIGIKDTSQHLRASIFRWHCFLHAIYGACWKLVSFLSRKHSFHCRYFHFERNCISNVLDLFLIFLQRCTLKLLDYKDTMMYKRTSLMDTSILGSRDVIFNFVKNAFNRSDYLKQCYCFNNLLFSWTFKCRN